MAGAMFGDVAGALFVAGAEFSEIWVDSRAKCCNFSCKMPSRARKVTSANGRVRDGQFMFGSCSNRPPL